MSAAVAVCLSLLALGAQGALREGGLPGACLDEDPQRPSLSLLQSQPARRIAHGYDVAGLRLALLVPGCQDRLLVRSKAEHVVRRLVQQGVHVDVFVDVVAAGLELGQPFRNASSAGETVDSPEGADAAAVAGLFRDAGAAGVNVSISDHVEDIQMPPQRPEGWHRLYQYHPFEETEPMNEVGRNVIRMFKTLERLYHKAADAAQSQGQAYDFVLFDHDDSEWLGPIDLSGMFDARWTPSKAVYSRDCCTYHGLNDHTFLFTWPAATVMLSRLFADIYAPNPRLNRANPENYWMALAQINDVHTIEVPPRFLPTAASVYVEADGGGSASLCQKPQYICPDLAQPQWGAQICGDRAVCTDYYHEAPN